MWKVLASLALTLWASNAFALQWHLVVMDDSTKEEKTFRPDSKEFAIPNMGAWECSLTKTSAKDDGKRVSESRSFRCGPKGQMTSMSYFLSCSYTKSGSEDFREDLFQVIVGDKLYDIDVKCSR